jgi:hypothetical protein
MVAVYGARNTVKRLPMNSDDYIITDLITISPFINVKEIEKKWNRTLCIQCRNLIDKIKIAQRNQSEEYKRYQQEYKKRKKQ